MPAVLMHDACRWQQSHCGILVQQETVRLEDSKMWDQNRLNFPWKVVVVAKAHTASEKRKNKNKRMSETRTYGLWLDN